VDRYLRIPAIGMRIPDDAVIPVAKITDYLLRPRDEDDKSKYLAQGGFTLDNPSDLEPSNPRGDRVS
jgi:hypothetical protein